MGRLMMTNSWGYPRSKTQDETAERISLGLQCPECFGVQITMSPRGPHDPYQHQCEECRCIWSTS
jgi:hypothetical protein